MSADDCDNCDDTGLIVSPMCSGILEPCPLCRRGRREADARSATSELINARIRQLETAIRDLIAHARPSNWDDDEDPEQVAAWTQADLALDGVAAHGVTK